MLGQGKLIQVRPRPESKDYMTAALGESVVDNLSKVVLYWSLLSLLLLLLLLISKMLLLLRLLLLRL